MRESDRIRHYKSKPKREIKQMIGTLQDMPLDYRTILYPKIGDKCEVSYPDGKYKGPIDENRETT